MTPEALAALHTACFVTPPPFSAKAFARMLDSPATFLCLLPYAPGSAFALGRAIAGEAELLTIAVAPDQRRRGLASQLLTAFAEDARQRGAETAFLEVAADNIPARALYEAGGYRAAGNRRGYYRTPGGSRVDAVIMQKALGPE